MAQRSRRKLSLPAGGVNRGIPSAQSEHGVPPSSHVAGPGHSVAGLAAAGAGARAGGGSVF